MKSKTITIILVALLLAATPVIVLNLVPSITKVYATEDTTPPVLNDVWVTPSVINDGESVTVHFDVTDDISGTETVTGFLVGPATTQSIGCFTTYNPSSGLWEGTTTIPQYADNGDWTVHQIYCKDKAQNQEWYSYGVDYTAEFTVNSGAVPVGDIWSSDVFGNVKDVFSASEGVYVTVPECGKTVSLYVMNDQAAWNDGDVLMDVSFDGVETLTLNSGQGTQTIQVWAPTTTVGDYDSVMDVDRDGVFDAELDRVDSLEIVGLSVIPEVPLGTVMAMLGMFVALVAFVGVKRFRYKHQN